MNKLGFSFQERYNGTGAGQEPVVTWIRSGFFPVFPLPAWQEQRSPGVTNRAERQPENISRTKTVFPIIFFIQ